MGVFDDERLTRLTICVTGAQRRKLGELARRAGRGVTLARVARAALDEGLDEVSRAMDQERMAEGASPGAVAGAAVKQETVGRSAAPSSCCAC